MWLCAARHASGVTVRRYTVVSRLASSINSATSGGEEDPTSLLLLQSAFESATSKLKLKELWDWYEVKYTTLKGRSISIPGVTDTKTMINGLQRAYPEHSWEPWRWENLPHEYWKDMENQKRYLRWLGDYIGVQSTNDWYFLRDTANGAPLLAMYNGSVMQIIQNVLPSENDWQPWCFVPTPRGLWEDKANHKRYFDWIAREYNIKSTDDWYNIRLGDMRKYGSKLLEKYNDSLILALQSVYPEQHFLPWRFNHTRKFIFEDQKYQREYLDWLGKELNITKPADWYYVNPSDIVARHGTEFLDRYDSDLLKALKTVYPEISWRLPEYPFPSHHQLAWSGRLPNLHVVRLKEIITKMFPDDKICII